MEPRLGLERVVDATEGVVERCHLVAEGRIGELRSVDRRADQAFAEQIGLEVEHPLAVSVGGRGTTVVHDVWREDRHHRLTLASLAPLEVVADGSVVDDEECPRVVRVARIRVPERRVQDFADAPDRRSPRPDADAVVCHRRIVQDRRSSAA